MVNIRKICERHAFSHTYIDGHPINYLRTNTNVQMADELYETYGIQEGDGMYLPEEERIHFFTDNSEQSVQSTLAA